MYNHTQGLSHARNLHYCWVTPPELGFLDRVSLFTSSWPQMCNTPASSSPGIRVLVTMPDIPAAFWGDFCFFCFPFSYKTSELATPIRNNSSFVHTSFSLRFLLCCLWCWKSASIFPVSQNYSEHVWLLYFVLCCWYPANGWKVYPVASLSSLDSGYLEAPTDTYA